MKRETETSEHTYQLPQGQLRVTQTFAIYREHYSGQNQVFLKKLEQTQFHADGEWLTDEMASELAAWVLEDGDMPRWLEEA